jgi:SAM-dependent methyltransferase
MKTNYNSVGMRARIFRGFARRLNRAADGLSLPPRIEFLISQTLGRSSTPVLTRSEVAFDTLQASWDPRSPYGYDPVSIWKRAASRSQTLVSIPGLGTPGKKILDVGAGDGMLGVALNAFGHLATLTDLEDWRHGAAKAVHFEEADCCQALPFEDASFDLVCSFNSFEHFPTPDTVLAEIVRVTKPGGWIYVDFNPLYASPWGLHAYRALRMPYPQFLLSEGFIASKLEDIGIWDLGKKRTELQFLNRWSVSEFDRLTNNPAFVVVRNQRTVDISELELVLQFPEAFQGRGLTFEDLTVSGLTMAMCKR